MTRPDNPRLSDPPTPVRDLPWVQPDEPDERPDPDECSLCDDPLYEEPGPLCRECRAGLGAVLGRDGPSWVAGPRARREGTRVLWGGEREIGREGWRDGATRVREDGR